MTTQDTSFPKTAVHNRADRHVVVVADRFARFADGQDVLTLSDLLMLVSSGAAAHGGGVWAVHIGQGIEESDCRVIESACGLNGSADVRVADRDSLLRPRVTPRTVHKTRQENVLLANVRNLSNDHCAADLCIHRDNELVLDHHTAEHVQGMVIIEAIRQICIAQFETGYRLEMPQFDYAGIWKRINLSFQDFLFALPATIVAEISSADLSRPAKLNFRARASIWQNGCDVASAELEYCMMEQARFRMIEGRRSGYATRTFLARFTN